LPNRISMFAKLQCCQGLRADVPELGKQGGKVSLLLFEICQAGTDSVEQQDELLVLSGIGIVKIQIFANIGQAETQAFPPQYDL